MRLMSIGLRIDRDLRRGSSPDRSLPLFRTGDSVVYGMRRIDNRLRTMAKRDVSQLVSVNRQAAETPIAAK